jgi:hypothetical protein
MTGSEPILRSLWLFLHRHHSTMHSTQRTQINFKLSPSDSKSSPCSNDINNLPQDVLLPTTDNDDRKPLISTKQLLIQLIPRQSDALLMRLSSTHDNNQNPTNAVTCLHCYSLHNDIFNSNVLQKYKVWRSNMQTLKTIIEWLRRGPHPFPHRLRHSPLISLKVVKWCFPDGHPTLHCLAILYFCCKK